MSAIKERILGAVTVMDDNAANELWQFIIQSFVGWDEIPEEMPDEDDIEMLAEMRIDPDCQSFVSEEEAAKILEK